jgi:hypothetical protein
MLLLLTVLACSTPAPAPVVHVSTKPTESKVHLFCPDDDKVTRDGYIQELLIAQGWAYAGQLNNNAIGCTYTLWVR